MFDSHGRLVEIQVLGPVEVVVGARRVRLSRLQRHLLAALAVEPGRVVSVDSLSESLWREDQPRDARNRIQALVSALRRLLGEDSILTRPPGYCLNLEQVGCDCDLFEQDLASPDALGHALARWRGAAFSGIHDPRVDIAAARLEELRLEATERLFEQRLESGRPGDVVPELTGLLAEHPFRERVRALLMTALYRCGRLNDALNLYREGYRLHQEELGVEPGARLQELHRSMLAGDGASSRPARPRALNQLPPATPHFTGRDREVVTLARRLTAPESPGVPTVVVISGMGGLGKTSLAVHAARAALPSYPDGCLFADLRGVNTSPSDPFLVMGAFMRALAGPGFAVPEDQDERLGLFRSMTATRRLLLVLDNASGEEQVRPLLPGGEACAILITSRASLAGLDGAAHLKPGGFDEASSVRLLRAIAGGSRIDGEPEAALRLAEMCSGLPLAVRIVGSRVVQQDDASLASLVDLLADGRARLSELTAGDRDVRAVIAMSHERLAPDAARLLCLLARLPVTEIPTWTAAHLLGVDQDAGAETMRQLSSASLLSPRGADRYHVHDLVRLYASQQAVAGESEALRRCYEALLGLVLAHDDGLPTHKYPAPAGLEPSKSGDGDPLLWFRMESQLVLGAAADASEHGRHEQAWRLAAGMTNFITMERFVAGWSEVVDQIRARLEPGGAGDGALLLAIGLVKQGRGEAAAAIQPLRQARRLFVRAGDEPAAVTAATRLSMAYRARGRWRAARAAVDWALRRLPAGVDPARLGWAHLALGNLLIEVRDLPPALDALTRALEGMRSGRDRAGEGNVLICLAQALRNHGERNEVVALHYRQAAEILAEVGDPTGLCVVEQALARMYLDDGDFARAREYAQRALELAESLHYPLGMKFALHTLGDIQLRTGDFLAARETLRSIVPIARPMSGPALAGVLLNLAEAEAALGEVDQARSLGHEALELYAGMNRSEADKVRAWLESLESSQ